SPLSLPIPLATKFDSMRFYADMKFNVVEIPYLLQLRGGIQPRIVLLVLICFSFLAMRLSLRADLATGEHGVVASVNEIATRAGINALKQGGNAVDAAVATALTLGVVDGYNSGIGGGCFMLIRLKDGKFLAIDGREMAPAAATRDMFLRDGKADTELSQLGALASGVPGSLAAYESAIRLCGKLPFRDHLLNAAKVAEAGFPVTRSYANVLKHMAGDLSKFESSKAIFLHDGKPFGPGEILKQTDLAKTYREVARNGIGWFYGGAFADATEKWMKQNGGIMTAADLKNYRIEFREPIFTEYRGHRIVSFPPPSSGGVHVAEILNILDHYNLKKRASNSPEMIHLVAEAMKLAFADRAYWLGDPAFAKVPRGLVSEKYAKLLASKINLNHATVVRQHGTPEKSNDNLFGKHTTHFSTADAEGNWVACTATVNTSFGSKVVIPGTGVVLNNQMDDFSAQPGVPNFFGLLGAEANAVAPGKRPLSSMSPTIVLKNGKPILSVGAAGGPTIISQTVLAIINVLDFGMGIEQAIAAPRFHHQWSPDELKIENAVGQKTFDELESLGHKLKPQESLGVAQAVAKNPKGKGVVGAADPRASGQAEAW
ncbi:MAG: gamma-glutamyltransferase, partial [Verrucomicrobiota bacterium]